MALTKLPVEMFVAFGIDQHGGISCEYQESSRAFDHCDVNIKKLLMQLGSQTRGLVCYHNHPDGSGHMSDEDKDLTERLKTALSAYNVTLMKHEVVAGDAHLQESRRAMDAPRYLTGWDRANHREADLWAVYGGHCPY